MALKILTVVGARPQFVKAGAVSRSIAKIATINEIIIHTGQHYDYNMSDLFFKELDIPKPTYKQTLKGKSHAEMTAEMMINIEKTALLEKPDILMVYGDTNSTLAGALVAAKIGIPIAHVESGLRSFNNAMPEEINRIVTDRLSTYLFCPSKTAVDNLAQEGISRNVYNVGDVMYDTVLHYKQLGIKKTRELEEQKIPERFILTTVHRQENTDNPQKLHEIFTALNSLAANIPVVLPLHPRTKSKLDKQTNTDNIIFLPPIGYLSMLYLLDNCSMVLTDSGGLQKEAYFFDKFVGILRDETEWVELVENNAAVIVGNNYQLLHELTNKFGKSMDVPKNIYGDGNASDIIAQHLSTHT